jgi:hypothetical protein
LFFVYKAIPDGYKGGSLNFSFPYDLVNPYEAKPLIEKEEKEEEKKNIFKETKGYKLTEAPEKKGLFSKGGSDGRKQPAGNPWKDPAHFEKIKQKERAREREEREQEKTDIM